MKHAVSAHSVDANVSTARVDLATRRTFVDFLQTEHDILNLSAVNTTCPP